MNEILGVFVERSSFAVFLNQKDAAEIKSLDAAFYNSVT